MTDTFNDVYDRICAGEANLFACWQNMRHFEGGELHDDGDCVWFISGLPIALFNGIMRPRFNADTLDARLDEVLAHFRARQMPMLVWLTSSAQPADLRAHLPQHGLQPGGGMPAMSVSLDKLNEDVPWARTLTVERVTQDTMHTWAFVVQNGYGMPPVVVPPLKKWFATLGLDNERGYRHYLVRDGADAVSVATLFVKDGVAGIYTVATLPAARGKGAGTLATLTPLRVARDEGCALGILQSSQMGYPIYRKLGFADDFPIEHWVWTP